MTVKLSSEQKNVNTTRGIPRDGFYWIFVNFETETPDKYSKEKAKETNFVLEHEIHGELPLKFRRKDKQFLYFKAKVKR